MIIPLFQPAVKEDDGTDNAGKREENKHDPSHGYPRLLRHKTFPLQQAGYSDKAQVEKGRAGGEEEHTYRHADGQKTARKGIAREGIFKIQKIDEYRRKNLISR